MCLSHFCGWEYGQCDCHVIRTGFIRKGWLQSQPHQCIYLCIYIFLYLFLERGREAKREGEKHNQLPLACPQQETWASTQAYALTGNRTGDPLVHRMTPNPLSHTSQGSQFIFHQRAVSVHFTSAGSIERLPPKVLQESAFLEFLTPVQRLPCLWTVICLIFALWHKPCTLYL